MSFSCRYRHSQEADQFAWCHHAEQRSAGGHDRHPFEPEVADQLGGLAHTGMGVHGRDAGVNDVSHLAATHLAGPAGRPPHRQGVLGDNRDNPGAVTDDGHWAVEDVQALPHFDHRIMPIDHRHVTDHHRTDREGGKILC